MTTVFSPTHWIHAGLCSFSRRWLCFIVLLRRVYYITWGHFLCRLYECGFVFILNEEWGCVVIWLLNSQPVHHWWKPFHLQYYECYDLGVGGDFPVKHSNHKQPSKCCICHRLAGATSTDSLFNLCVCPPTVFFPIGSAKENVTTSLWLPL